MANNLEEHVQQRTNYKAMEKMDVKKRQSTSSTKKLDGRKIVGFVGDIKKELKRVEWTNKEELKGYTRIVLFSIIVFGLFIYFIDLIIQGFLGGINLLIKFFTG